MTLFFGSLMNSFRALHLTVTLFAGISLNGVRRQHLWRFGELEPSAVFLWFFQATP